MKYDTTTLNVATVNTMIMELKMHVIYPSLRSQANFEAALEAMGGESRPGSPPEPNPRQSGAV